MIHGKGKCIEATSVVRKSVGGGGCRDDVVLNCDTVTFIDSLR